ncbi:MAG: hypothetical protein HYW45_02825 [Candidatus Daviesbacteria bacterium]|nr:MAG: hypothetical protein HYW45_02825 [Candidatus Daviesbacteria bacterium]
MDKETKIAIGAGTISALAILGGWHLGVNDAQKAAPIVQLADKPDNSPKIVRDSSITPTQLEELYRLLGYQAYGREIRPNPNEGSLTFNRLQRLADFFSNFADPFLRFDGQKLRLSARFPGPQLPDINNPNDAIYVNALVESHLQEKYFQQETRQEFNLGYTGYQVTPYIQALRDRLTFINPDQTYFVPPQNLAQLHLTLQTMEQQGKKVPHKALVSSDPNNLNVAADEDTIVLGHSMANSLGRYYGYDHNLFDKYKRLIGTQMDDRSLDYILTTLVGRFLTNGTELRNEVLYAQLTDKPNLVKGYFTQAEYDIVRNWLGVDISRYGIPVEIRNFAPGENATILDPAARLNRYDFGIILREKPEPGLDPTRPYVEDGERVTVLEGPKTVLFRHYQEATDMYKVEAKWDYQVKTDTGDWATVWLPFDPPKIGWIRADFMEASQSK